MGYRRQQNPEFLALLEAPLNNLLNSKHNILFYSMNSLGYLAPQKNSDLDNTFLSSH